MNKVILAIVMYLIISPSALAAVWDFEFLVGNSSINQELAGKHAHEDNALSLGMASHLEHNYVRVGLGFMGVSPEEDTTQTITVIDQYGNQSSSDSSSDYWAFYAEAGPTYTWKRLLRGTLNLGYESIVATRLHGSCWNCPKTEIDAESGFFIKPSIELLLSPKETEQFGGIGLVFAYKSPLGSNSIEEGWQLGVNLVVGLD